MRILFVKRNQSFPRSSGHDVHTYYMMRSLAGLGEEVGLLTVDRAAAEATEGVDLVWQGTFNALPIPEKIERLPRFQEKFRSYWGIDPKWPTQLAQLVAREAFDAVVVVGLDVLPFLGAVQGAKRVWYAADEWFLHHLSLVHWSRPSSYREIKVGAIKGLYERVYNSCTDIVWSVSEKDSRYFRWVMGAKQVDLVPNGVDSDFFAPRKTVPRTESLVFWGRLDFEPNIDAIQWFGEKVWKSLKAERPNASWTVYGFGATDFVRRASQELGFELVCDLPDLRDAVTSHQVAVLPFISGAGIKNKLLEGAAMGVPIVASEKALTGLDRASVPLRVAHDPAGWCRAIKSLWDNPSERLELGQKEREWVVSAHSWNSAANQALRGLKRT